jgi:hypothetical protein
MRFNQSDRERLECLIFDRACEPSYELMKSCLVWPDERPAEITNEGYELLGDLWIVRGLMHRDVPPEKWGLDPAYFQEVWRNALADVPRWPGFRRLDLSAADRTYLSRSIAEAAGSEDC